MQYVGIHVRAESVLKLTGAALGYEEVKPSF
jgi:hypothetical protein